MREITTKTAAEFCDEVEKLLAQRVRMHDVLLNLDNSAKKYKVFLFVVPSSTRETVCNDLKSLAWFVYLPVEMRKECYLLALDIERNTDVVRVSKTDG